jgi:transcriptional regulator with XRE-family HTH domain
MSFGDIGARMKQKADEKKAANAAPPPDFAELHLLRGRILGVLLQDARLSKGRSENDCALEVGVPLEYYREWELGKRSPTLPQLEVLAYFIGVPVSHFWNTKTISAEEQERHIPKEDFIALRDRVVGALIRIKRTELGLSEADLASACGLDPILIEQIELARAEIPFTVLTSVASALRVPINYFMDDSSRVGEFLGGQEAYRKFGDLPAEVRDWVVQSSSLPFIQIAMKLSKIPVQELRAIGENILDITF